MHEFSNLFGEVEAKEAIALDQSYLRMASSRRRTRGLCAEAMQEARPALAPPDTAVDLDLWATGGSPGSAPGNKMGRSPPALFVFTLAVFLKGRNHTNSHCRRCIDGMDTGRRSDGL